MLIDDITITVVSGNGSKGAVAFNKNMMSLGPAGGSGGNGGSVYAEGIPDIGALRQFRHKKEFAAMNGGEGRSQFRDGRDGDDLILKVPVGVAVHNLAAEKIIEITKVGERVLLAQGGHGGKGNFQYKSSTNTSPREFQNGFPGEHLTLRFELKLIADVGFVGLPNAGKSSLLNELTNAKAKVANYPFTTLEPNLGAYYELILADIPGLIEGSSSGKGLGVKFLRHIERTRILFHLVSAESPAPADDYRIVRKELETYAKALVEKPEYLFLSKSDCASPAELKKKLAALKKLNPKIIAISIEDGTSIKKVQKILNALKAEK
ncbi:MAG: GTPase ObgE [Candidatus Liptonbacteria bacterium]|nr:GTPase ObgE [Candidatus Liptonbacteria bacterium]